MGKDVQSCVRYPSLHGRDKNPSCGCRFLVDTLYMPVTQRSRMTVASVPHDVTRLFLERPPMTVEDSDPVKRRVESCRAGRRSACGRQRRRDDPFRHSQMAVTFP